MGGSALRTRNRKVPLRAAWWRQSGPIQPQNGPEQHVRGLARDPGQTDQPQQQGEKPDDKGQNPPHGENQNGPPRLDESGQPVPPGGDAERWGFLPERFQETFRNQGADDLPVQYRDWIDSYYRRLNEQR